MIGDGRRFMTRVLAGSSFFRFATVGVITTLLDFVLFAGLTQLGQLAPAVANIFSYCCGIALSFALNRHWTFGRIDSNSPAFLEAMKFALSYAAGLVLSTVLVYALAHVMPALIAKTLAVAIVLIWNYSMSRYWVFRQDKTSL